MQPLNLDLLRTLPHHPDGTSKDPHARHGTELRARLRAERSQRWKDRIARLRRVLAQQTAPVAAPCSSQLP